MSADLLLSEERLESMAPDNIDLLVVAAGYEPRCTHIASRLGETLGQKRGPIGQRTLVLRFRRHSHAPSRLRVERELAEISPRWVCEIDDQDGRLVLHRVREVLQENGIDITGARIMVDYSSMSRSLYLCLIQLLREGCSVVFAYSVGMYGTLKRRYPISSLGTTIRSVPGLEGAALALRPRFYMFGLGFDGIGARALADRLEAETYGVFWAAPGASVDAAPIAERVNADLIRSATVRFRRKLSDVRGVCDTLVGIIDECSNTHKAVLCPVGPKPHILAAGLSAFRRQEATLLAPHAPGGGFSSDELPLIEAAGEVVVTAVRWALVPASSMATQECQS